MIKLGDTTPKIIDKAIDFMASSQAFREYLAHKREDFTPDNIPDNKRNMYQVRLQHYRQLYRPARIQEKETEESEA